MSTSLCSEAGRESPSQAATTSSQPIVPHLDVRSPRRMPAGLRDRAGSVNVVSLVDRLQPIA